MPVFEDWLKNPISIINNIFESDPVNFESKVQEYFESKIKLEKNYFSIPCLNEVPIHELTPNCLVRYRCMIQDSFDPVYYTGVQQLKHKTTGETILLTLKYKEDLDVPEGYEIHGDALKDDFMKIYGKENEEKQSNLHQRITFYCVPIPGETDWVKNGFKSQNNSGSSTKSFGSSSNTSHRPVKRGIESENDQAMQSEAEPNSIDQHQYDLRVVCTEKNTDTIVCKVCLKYKTKSSDSNESETKTITFTKKTKVEEIEQKSVNLDSINLTHNFPLASNETGPACLVKAYDNCDNFKVNDLVEFIGILSQDPSLAYMYDEHKDYLDIEQDEKISEFKLHEENKMETEDHVCKCTEVDVNVTKYLKHTKKVILSEYPPSLVPRLHCIKSNNLLHDNPLIPRTQNEKSDSTDTKIEEKKEEDSPGEYWSLEYSYFLKNILAESNDTMPSHESILLETAQSYLNRLRNDIIVTFQELLLGDCLAAEYLLMHLLSSVFMRRDVTVLGKFSLNISNIPQISENGLVPSGNGKKSPKNFAECFYDTLKQFITMGHLFKLTTENLNKSNLIPNKDYNKDKLVSGMLQLPDNFQLVIDETVLNSGELNQKGLMNFNSISEIIKWQKMNYDFSYHQQEFSTNIRVLTLSETKSILPFDIQIKLKPTVEHFEADKYEAFTTQLFSEANSRLINNIRKYLTILGHLDYKLTQTMQQLVEDDIVQIRQTPMLNSDGTTRKEKMCIEDFHMLLVVARLQTLSYGKCELGLQEWNRAKSIEFERLKHRV